MTPKERVLCAFEHKEPDRVPIWIGSSEEFWAKARQTLGLDDEALRIRLRDDFRRVYAVYRGPEFPLSEEAVSRTVFGIERGGLGYGQPLNHPLADADMAAVEAYPWPDPDWMDVSGIRADAAAYADRYAILGGDWAPFWHDVMELFGMENLFIKMYTEPDLVEAVFKKVVDYYVAVNRHVLDAAADVIDILFIGNDFGSQIGPLIGPDLFRRFVWPHLKRLIDLGHDYGLKVQLHCCGGVAQLVPLMIEAGLDALHAVQPSCTGMDLVDLKRRFGDHLVFNGAIDSHHVLIEGTAETVRQKTREVLEIMMPDGGYVAGASHDSILGETPVENILAMVDAVEEYGRYS